MEKMTIKDSLCGVIVLYNPDENVIGNIASYNDNLGRLYVIDNSEIPNYELTTLIKLNAKVSYYSFTDNLGIAKALNIACDMARKDGFCYILTMDQDSKFVGADFFELVNKNLEPEIGIYAASFTNEYDRWVKTYNNEFDEIHFVITSGNIVNLAAWAQVHGFEEKLFIDEVDHDFCVKLRLNGYKVLTSKRVLLNHKIGIDIKIGRPIQTHAPIRHYYMTRNILFIIKKYILTDFTLAFNRFIVLLKSVRHVIIYYPEKSKYFKYISLGFFHFFMCKFGKLKQQNKTIKI